MPKNHHAIAAVALSMVANQYGAPVKKQARAQAATTPTAYQLAGRAAADADRWFATKGVRAQALNLTLGAPKDGEHVGYGWSNTGNVQIDPSYLDHVNKLLQDRKASRHGKIAALAGMWRIMAHERGHNAALEHTPGGIMDEGWVDPPGDAYAWAASALGPAAKKRLR